MKIVSDTGVATEIDVAGWRERRLEAAGFDERTAVMLAGDCGFDLHGLINLVEAGCPPAVAVRIMAPIDLRPRPC
ncbi:MAG TPA: hypothetical protein VHS27_04810 [Gaiellales bacterium]|jgi:hypothetical protein|nr:hypothetical protein [Gaiellales bacterium]